MSRSPWDEGQMEAAREVGAVEGREVLLKVVLARDEDNRESILP